MKKQDNCTSAANTMESLDIVGELHLNGYDYLIISLSNGEDDSLVDMFAGVGSTTVTEIRRFEVGGYLCAIVQPEHPPAGTITDLTQILTERELQIATLVALGRLNKQIADKLHISEWTVSTHLRRIFAKLGVRSRAAMVYRCAPLIGERHSVSA